MSRHEERSVMFVKSLNTIIIDYQREKVEWIIQEQRNNRRYERRAPWNPWRGPAGVVAPDDVVTEGRLKELKEGRSKGRYRA